MKTICIYHSRDLDGWMSAAIVKKWFLEEVEKLIDPNYTTETGYGELKNENSDFVVKIIRGVTKKLTFLGWDYGDSIPDLSEYDKVIMCDISFPKEEMLKINLKLGTNFIWIDHHQRTVNEVNSYIIDNGVPMEGLVTEDGELKAACELTWEYFFPDEEIPEAVKLLGLYDSFRHKGTYREQEVLEFQYGARQVISNYEEAYSVISMPYEHQETFLWDTLEKGKTIYQYLCSEAKQTYTRAFPVELSTGVKEFNIQKQKEDFYGKTYKFLCVNQDRFNPVNFGINYHEDGYDGFACFWYKDNKWTFSLYNDNGEVDCSAIAKQYGGGGHKGAAGFTTDNIDEIIK